jgi:hypothetical protein
MVLCAAPLKLATTGFQTTGADPALARAWTERFAEVARRDGRVDVTTQGDIEQLLTVQRQKSLLGCETVSSECLIEVASALGADGIIVGTIARSESGYLVTLRVLRGKTAQVWWSASDRKATEGALLDWLDAQAKEMVDVLAPRASGNPGPFVLGGAGVVALGTGATLIILSNTVAVAQVRNAPNAGELKTALEAGKTQGAAGFIVGGVGVAALAGAVVWGLAGAPPSAPKVAVVPLHDGAFVTLGGVW